MARRAGSADLPLHGGRVPLWLADRMTRLGAVISEAIIHTYGRDELLRRLAHPFWFQSFGAVMGMDWHSSGITTSVIGALKRGLEPLSGELGIHVCGGRGKQSRKTPLELAAIGERVGIDGSALANVSRLVAKVDSAAVQDGFDLYLHGFIVTDDGNWTVVQQGMNDFEPHGSPLSLAVRRTAEFRRGAAQGDRRRSIKAKSSTSLIVAQTPPVGRSSNFWIRSVPTAWRANSPPSRRNPEARAFADPVQLTLPHLVMPAHHDVRASDVLAPACTRLSQRRPIGDLPTSPNCFWFPASAPVRCGRSRWWPKSFTARPIVSPIRRASRSHMAARTGIRSRCP